MHSRTQATRAAGVLMLSNRDVKNDREDSPSILCRKFCRLCSCPIFETVGEGLLSLLELTWLCHGASRTVRASLPLLALKILPPTSFFDCRPVIPAAQLVVVSVEPRRL